MAKTLQSAGAVFCCVGVVTMMVGSGFGVALLLVGLLVFILGRMAV